MTIKLQRPAERPPSYKAVPKSLCDQYAPIQQGLYVFLFDNPSDVNVFDRNTKPQVVVRAGGLSIKPGKFEGSFLKRVTEYRKHLHRPSVDGGGKWTLYECFRTGYLFDFSGHIQGVGAPARVFEAYLVHTVEHFLKQHDGLLQPKQLKQAEWRYLEKAVWTPRVASDFEAYLEQVHLRIDAMAEVGAFLP